MAKVILEDVETKGVGFGPIIQYYFEKCRIAQIIDENVPLDPRRKVLSHGEACVSMITGIMFQVLQLYKICKFAKETTILETIYPHIPHYEYFDDRLADTLDAVFDYGIGNLETQITQRMIEEFVIETELCHNDTTSASFYGNCDKKRTDKSIKISFGHSKKHREDLKQLVWSLSVSSDGAFPLFQKAYSGNTADVTTYVEQWNNLIDLLGNRDFLYVADSKLITKENMAHIHDNEGFFIAPAPMYETYKKAFYEGLDQHKQEVLIPYKDQINRGFEVPLPLTHEQKEYPFRMIILYDHGLSARKRKTIDNRIAKTRTKFDEISNKLNKYNLKTKENIEKACDKVLKQYHTLNFFTYKITNDPIITYKNTKRGRSPKGKTPPKTEVVKDNFSVELVFDEQAYENELYYSGYYPLITNKTQEDLSIRDAMMAHKNQYKSEHINRRAKSSYKLEPIYLHTPERIEALLFLFKIALQVIVLIERTARKNINERDRGLDDFMPNRKDVRNPRTEYLLKEFEFIVKGEIPLPDGKLYGFVSKLNELQSDILSILEVPEECYTYQYLFNSG